MKIEKNKKMLLFRYNNYKKTDFITAHRDVLNENGYVWMLKIGKKTSVDKIKKVMSDGGYLILRAPKADGSLSYITHFTEISEDEPDDFAYPEYYDTFLTGEDSFQFESSSKQWFKLDMIKQLDEKETDKLILALNGKKVNEVIATTMTAVMFISCDEDIKFV